MADLRTRFATLDRLPAPDLWAEVERRAMATTPASGPQRLTGVRPTWRGGFMEVALVRYLAVADQNEALWRR